jgi:lipoyl(octanoyl) transferase
VAVELPDTAESVLRAYLFGLMDFDAALHLQRRFVDQVQGDRGRAFVIFCEHPPQISVGREGSWAHLQSPTGEMRSNGLPVRWVNRGGGCILHQPGQLAIYSIMALDRRGLTIPRYLEKLHLTLADALHDFCLPVEISSNQRDVCVSGRPIAQVGVAVTQWVGYFGAVLNINPDLSAWRRSRWEDANWPAMTSIERERRGPLRVSLLRERLLEHLANRFGFERTSLFMDHPSLRRKVTLNALTTPS